MAAVAAMTHLLSWFAPWAASELLFVALSVWFLHALESGASLRLLIPLAALASLTRYVGVTILATGILILAWRREWKRAICFGILASLPLAIWIGRNWIYTGTLIGLRVPSPFGVGEVVSAYYHVVGWWALEIGAIFGVCYGVDRVFCRLQRLYAVQRDEREI
jgi:hypothetical protein